MTQCSTLFTLITIEKILVYWPPSVDVIKRFSLPMMLRYNKLECLSPAKPFQPDLIFAG